ncbi:MAG: 3-oxoacyl-[acyl-carrier-protein] synthase 3 [Candidatus Ordinivivax streblomastigis]|uniref:3-oxoacyl-[acyl-carrier-protein] synthase 3 n=1 Tax=Candidatus Ordinivivax streblomastigis TaxID=2540710 RepID=A0A5M8P1X1_9BACT|nr:MAG: 3-oxoacyl-[acyl-carrier-protein] synthase 3 [Candidatus Ordinivivax streblomastigis]
MAFLQFDAIGISGLAAAVPETILNNYEYTSHFPKEDVKEVVDKIGIKERRFADANTCSSDLCFAAAEKLLTEMSVNREEIDLLVFVSQTPDYRMPATSLLLQERLGLAHHTIAFDINLGCSGFIYGLSVVYGFMQQQGIRKALLLDGETRSKVYSPKDRKTAFIFGDGGVAALIERNEKYGKSYFSLNSDGSREGLIKINAGGYRNPSSLETLKEKVVDEYGNIRNDEQGYMNGGDVFNFVIREVPRDIQSILEYSQTDQASIDHFIFHQANDYMNSYLIKKLKIDKAKVPSTIAKFGNTSSVSVPLTIASELQHNLHSKKTLLLSAFGVGMTWASAILNTDDLFIPDLVEV